MEAVPLLPKKHFFAVRQDMDRYLETVQGTKGASQKVKLKGGCETPRVTIFSSALLIASCLASLHTLQETTGFEIQG